MPEIPKGTKCEFCGKHEATSFWVANGSMLEYSHGYHQYICKCCALKEQLKYAKKQARRIPGLEKKLKKYKCK